MASQKTIIPKSDLVFLMRHRLKVAIKRIFDEEPDSDEDGLKKLNELAEWLLDSGHVTQQTMFSLKVEETENG